MSHFSLQCLCLRSLMIFVGIAGTSISLLGQQSSYIQDIPGTKASVDMVWIPAGNLKVKTMTGQSAVELNGFWMSKYEITYGQYKPFRVKEWDGKGGDMDYDVDAVARPTPPYQDFTHGMGSDDDFPAVSMTQQAALKYCEWLYYKTGIFYRLPTDLEWEYACLGGTTEKNAERMTWHWENSDEKYHKVGKRESNGYGLQDMLGNVSEYTVDQYLESGYNQAQISYPHMVASPVRGKYGRSVRGGAFDDAPEDCSCRSAIPSNSAWQARDPQIPKSKWWNPDSPFVGFRIIRPAGNFTEDEVKAYFNRVIKY
ncbi:MAG: SUMF1/EgtB/PvdO family nonheme iron enzyme [Saprospiraceae bacterium]|nr:SUMF1/EgtB/PvdO family nonheme iron enzyme [Saprospiraceae bacterium]